LAISDVEPGVETGIEVIAAAIRLASSSPYPSATAVST
jgi:hypothetical protein